MTVVELCVYALLLAVAAAAVWRRPLAALYLFIVGLALHNAVMAALYAAGVRGSTLTVITAWKEILLAVALLHVVLDAWRGRRLPFAWNLVDWFALAFAALAVLYAFIPQTVLDGAADHRAIALGLRHDVVPVGAYFLGRSLVLRRDDLYRIGWTVLGVGAFVAALGIVDMYAVSIGWWRTNGVIDYFHRHLGYDYHGTGTRTESNGSVYGLPENFIYNVGNDRPFLRRLVSTFLSPLASGYLFVVALLIGLRARALAIALSAVVAAGLLFTFSRSSLVALAGALVVLAVLRRRPQELAAAAVVIVVAVGWAHLFPKIAPTGHFTKADLAYLHAQAKKAGPTGNFTAVSENEPSLHEHWTSLKDGVRTAVHHPQGYGLGNVGQTASRTGTPLKAGESNYTELGVELGVLGALLWIAWNLGAFWLIRNEVRVAAAFAAILALAIQTDVIGDPWVSYCVWGLVGACVPKSVLWARTSHI
ncbi:MAG TPA: O-antigen ligase family protein [Gaiellaceae bacterium]